jgi:predicted DsbA family dithiol-disulfide isomerase
VGKNRRITPIKELVLSKVELDVVSDIMCPWCFIGKRRLEKALSMLDGIDVEVRWRPYQLDATLPEEGKDRKKYLEDKFGGPEQAREIYSRIEDAGKSEGLDFAFDKIKVAPNTLNAHRVIRWAANEGEEAQQKIVERLFELFFMEGANIGDPAILLEAAKTVGMNTDVMETLLPTDADRPEVENEIEAARKMGVTGVPCFIINNKYAVMGAQEPQTIAEAIKNAAAEMKEETVE